ncbi:TonB family protein [Coleofasciculus chthonoplastes]|uniref:TonB family protein n=1 Tax=Coleofasciculus chthonoplastes TaxID=64178 RepID=UPI0032F98607
MSNLLFKTVSEKLNQPTGIAVMASVGIHVILGLTLPFYVPVFSNEAPPTRRTVQMLELSEADLSRLPDLSLPTIPPYIYQQTPLQSPFPPLPSLPSPLPQESLPLDGTISVAPPSQSLKIPSSSSTRKRTRTRISLNQPSTPFPSMRRNLGIPVFPSQLPPPPPLGTTNPESSSTETEPTPSIDRLAAQLRDRNSALLTTPHSKPPEDPKDKKLVALNPDTAPSANEDEPTPNPEESASESDHPIADQDKPNQAENSTRAQADKVEPPPVLQRTLVASYPQAACQKQLNGTAMYSVVVGADGKPTNLQMIRQAGDPILDQKAQEQINAQRFLNRTEQPQEYRVSVQFSGQEKVCPKPTPPEASNQNPEPSNSPTPQPVNPEASEESDSNNSASDNQPTSDREPTNSGQQSPSETTSESDSKTAQPEESANPQPSPEDTPEASKPRDNSVIVPTL